MLILSERRYTDQLHGHGRTYLGRGTVWGERFYCYLRSRSADKRGATRQGMYQKTYTVTVHVDVDGDMVIIQNPTLAPAMEKSSYEPKAQEAENSVDANTVNDARGVSGNILQAVPYRYGQGACLLCRGKRS